MVAVPATPQDNFSLLKASLASGDPVIYMEHKELWGQTGPVDTTLDLPLGRANVMHEGSDLTIVTWSRGVVRASSSIRSECSARLVQTFCPWTTYLFPCLIARVLSAGVSEPEVGSVTTTYLPSVPQISMTAMPFCL